MSVQTTANLYTKSGGHYTIQHSGSYEDLLGVWRAKGYSNFKLITTRGREVITIDMKEIEAISKTPSYEDTP